MPAILDKGIVTASLLEDEKINVLQLDIQGYIPKPFHESELFKP